jgi:protein-tyrosine phosphatase
MTKEEGVQLHVTFVCTFNVLRSAMAEKMFTDQIGKRRLGSRVRCTSCCTDGNAWAGNPIEGGAGRVLQSHGYPTAHRAARIGADHLGADLLVALTRSHARFLARHGVPAERIRLLRSFAPQSGTHAPDVEDPYWSARPNLDKTYNEIATSLPGLHQWVDDQLAARGMAS